MTERTEEYLEGKAAYCNSFDCSDNPHYLAFGELPEEYFEWQKGWQDAEDEQYAFWDDRESEDWQSCLNEEEAP